MVDKLATEVGVINEKELLASFSQGITTVKWHWEAKDWKQVQESGFLHYAPVSCSVAPPPRHPTLGRLCMSESLYRSKNDWMKELKISKKQTFVAHLWKLLSCKELELERTCGESVQEYLFFLLFPSISFWLLWDNILGWMCSMDIMWLFFHACTFAEMVTEGEVKRYYICATVFSGFIHLKVWVLAQFSF